MATTIDALAIDIDANAKIPAQNIDNLARKMSALATSIGSVNSAGMTRTAMSLRTLNSAMQGLSGVNMANYTRIASGLTKISSVDSAKLGQSATAIKRISNSLSSLNGTNVSASSKQIVELASGISKLGYKSTSKAIENIPKLATALKQLMTTLSSAPTVSNNLIQMTNALGNLARTGASSGKAANSLTTSLGSYSKGTTTATKKSFSLASALGKLYAGYWLVFRGISKVKDAVDYAADLTEVQNVVDNSFGSATEKVNQMAEESISTLGMSELAFKEYASQYQSMGLAMGIASSDIAKANDFLAETTDGYVEASDSLSDVSLNLTKLAGDMASFYNKDQAEVAEDLRSIYTGMVVPLRTYGLDLTQSTLKEWALKNGLDADIDSMTQAEKTMLRYQYVMANTKTVQNDFIRTSDTWANQTRILSENFKNLGATIGTPIINAVKPVVTAINNMIVKINQFAQVVSEALGTIFGWKYEVGQGGMTTDFEDAEDASSGIADNTGTAASNAKKLKNYLMGIDELNVLSEDTSSSSGSGSSGSGSSSGSSSADSSSIGKWVEVEREFDSSINTLEKLGKSISNALSNAMESIDWNGIYQKASNFGTGLASFLNGMFAGSEGERLFQNMGTTLANTLNTVIYASLTFATTLKWDEIGQNIASGVNSAFENFDATSLAQSINKWVQGIFSLLTNAIGNIDWLKVYDKIIEVLENIDIKTTAIVIGAVTLKKIGKVVAKDGLAEFIGNSISEMAKQVPIVIQNLKILASGGLIDESGILSKIANAIAMAVGGAGTLNETLSLTFGKLATNLAGTSVIIGGVALTVTNFFAMWENGFSWLEEALLVAGAGIAAIGLVILGVTAPVALLVAGAVAGVATIAVVVHDNWDKIKGFTSSLIDNIKNIFSPLVDFIKTKIIEPITRRFEQFKEGISIIFQAIEKIGKVVWDAIKTSVYKTFIEPAITRFEQFKDTVSNLFSIIGLAISTVFYSSRLYKDFIHPAMEAFESFATWISNIFSTIGNSIADAMKFIVNVVIGTIESGINSPIEGLNTFLRGFNSVVSAAAKITGNKWSGVDLIPTVSLPRFENGGFVGDADLFLANENGIPELVGTMNGKPAVGSGQEITGISNAVYSTSQEEIIELRQMNSYLRQLLAKDTTVNIGDRDIARANRRGEKQLGMQIIV